MKRHSRIILMVAGLFAMFTLLRLSIKVEICTTLTDTRDERIRADNVQTQTTDFPRNSNTNIKADTSFENEHIQAAYPRNNNKNIEADTSFKNEQIQAANPRTNNKIIEADISLEKEHIQDADQTKTIVLNPHLKTPTGAGILNIYNISNTKPTNPYLCVKSSTQTVFTICTWELEKDKYVSGSIHKTGQWEPVISQKMHNVLKQSRNKTFVDIGANIGYFSLLAASTGQHVISVEPWEQHIQKIVNSIHVNKFEDRMTIVNNAVSNSRRELQFYVPWANNQGAARLVLDNQMVGNTQRFSATSIILNDLADLILTKDVVIKIDIEGHECLAMEKSDQIFDRFNVLFISMEWVVMKLFKNKHGAACPRENILKMLDMLKCRGFIPYSFIDNKQLDIKQSDTWTFDDIYWIPKQNLFLLDSF